MRIFDYFKKKKEPENNIKEVELSKIDKHINLILRQKLASNNKTITTTLNEIEETQKNIIHKLRELHKKNLMNPNIPRREIQIMEGNRDNYIKNIARFITHMEVPKQYLELYYYTTQFSGELEKIFRETQKNMFILKEFFENEIKNINNELNKLEEKIISIRIIFEKHNIQKVEEIMQNVKKIKNNITKEIRIKHEISEHEAIIKEHEEKIKKLEERITTITSGTDYKALENFKQEKETTENEIKKIFKEFDEKISEIYTALKKYYYKNPDKKILKEYLEEPYKALINDNSLEIAYILKDIAKNINTIDLKDKKKENTEEALEKLSFEYIKNIQAQVKKLEDHKKHLQTKITHNSASLNLSEQEYWLKANKEKIKSNTEIILKLEDELSVIEGENKLLKKTITEELEKMMGENIILKDDLNLSISVSLIVSLIY
ncbi:MAG: hypothetical protein KatS3mg002_0670 [Candidatus Woesearchaeota archaeon]|nr:MAG: hypothetical protein KatS3mg002_0670 [Candidatus Woesearchaeota archaeon]